MVQILVSFIDAVLSAVLTRMVSTFGHRCAGFAQVFFVGRYIKQRTILGRSNRFNLEDFSSTSDRGVYELIPIKVVRS